MTRIYQYLYQHFLKNHDFSTIVIATFLIPTIWYLLLGLPLNGFIVGHDGIIVGIPILRHFLESHGDWSQGLYSASWKGGVKLFQLAGLQPAPQLFAWMNLPLTAISNLNVWIIQILAATLSIFSARNLVIILTEKKDFRFDRLTQIFALVVTGFAPVLAWRLFMGHEIIANGAIAFLAGLTLLTAAMIQSLSPSQVLMSTLAFTTALQGGGPQTLVYSAIFGLPIFLGVFSIKPKLNLQFHWVYLIPFAAILLSAPKLLAIIENVRSSDAARTIGGESVTYSYITATLEDWWTSLFWSIASVVGVRNPQYYHEINYPFGPLILMLFALPFRQMKWLLIGALTSGVLAILFSMNISPFSDLILLLPTVSSFRVPERSIFSFSLFLPVIALVIFANNKSNSATNIICFIVFLVSFFLPPTGREVIAWLSVILIIASYKKILSLTSYFRASALAVVAAASLGAFIERAPGKFRNYNEITKPTQDLGAFVLQQAPSLAMPLNRITMTAQANDFFSNTAKVAGLSSIDGYWFQPLRYLKTLAALQNREYHPTENNHTTSPEAPGFQQMQQLYNITHLLELQNGQLVIKTLPSTPGPAWFATELKAKTNYQEWAHDVQRRPTHMIAKELNFISTDPVVQKLAPSEINKPQCAQSQILSVKKLNTDQDFEIEYKSEDSCPMAIAMTYTEILHAYLDANPNNEIATLPIHGTLLGLMAPAGSHKIQIHAQLASQKGAIGKLLTFSWIAGLFIVLLACYFIAKKPGSQLVPVFFSRRFFKF